MFKTSLCAVLCLTFQASAGDTKADIATAKAFIASLELGPTLQNGDVTVVPLLRSGAANAPELTSLWMSKGVSFSEPEFPRHRYNLVVSNDSSRPLYLPGGTVVVGGKIDRLVRRDHLIAPGASVEIRTLPAASSADTRKEPTQLVLSPVLAPLYIRSKAEFGGSNSLVPSFVAKWVEFRNEGDDRLSLAAFVESKSLREYIIATPAKLNKLPDGLTTPQTVGGIAALHGRLQSLTAFGSNEILASEFPPAVKGATYAAAALAIRSKVAGIPLPGIGDPAKRKEIVHEEATKLLKKLQKATYRADKTEEGEVGSAIQLRLSDGTRGRINVLNGSVVHLVLYPRDPFRDKLYGRTIQVPDTKADPNAEPDKGGSSGGSSGSSTETSDYEDNFIDRGRRGGRRGGGRRR
jgi:hypothetical protein